MSDALRGPAAEREHPTPAQVAKAADVVRSHQPFMSPGTVLSARPCLGCGDSWPCPAYRNAIHIENLAYGWIGEAVYPLPDRFADRLPANELTQVRRLTAVGEWDEAVDLLLACLREFGVAVTTEEREVLRSLAEAMRLPAD